MQPNPFTERENEVVHLLLRGLENKQMAKSLGISERTVEFHLSNIFSKLGVNSRTEAVLKLSGPAVTQDQINTADPVLRESPVVNPPQTIENGNIPHRQERFPMKHRIIFNVILIVIIVVLFDAYFLVQRSSAEPTPLPSTNTPNQVTPGLTPSLTTSPNPSAISAAPVVVPEQAYTQTVGSTTVTLNLEWFYIDSGRLYLQFSISGYSIPSGEKISYLVANQNIHFFNSDGSALAIQLDQYTSGGTDAEPVPQNFETAFAATFTNPNQVIAPGVSYKIVIPVGGQVYDENSKAVELTATTFTLTATSFYPGSLTFTTNQTAKILDKTITFTKMEVNLTETYAFLCISDPEDEQWLPAASILYDGKSYQLLGANLISGNADPQTGLLCYRLKFAIPVNLSENPQPKLALWLLGLTKDQPEIFSPEMIQQALDQVAKQGIVFKYILLSHTSDFQITQKPSGMTDAEALAVIQKALTQQAATNGVVIFTLD